MKAFRRICYGFFSVSLFLFLLSKNREAATIINNTVSGLLRMSLSRVFSTLGFSFFEFLIILSPLVLLGLICYGKTLVKIKNIIAVFLVIFSLYFLNLGVAYNAKTPLEKEGKITEGELIELSEILLESVNLYSGEIKEKSPVEYGGVRVKELAFSRALTHLRILGLYSFMTSEANVNNVLPSFMYYFTSFHEISHVLGYAREGEANLFSYIALKETGDEYFSFCADLYSLFLTLNFIKISNENEYLRLWDLLSCLAKNEIAQYENCLILYPEWKIFRGLQSSYSSAVDTPSYNDFLRLLYLYIFNCE